MRIGLNGGGHARDLATIREQAKGAARDGFSSYWLSQIYGPDALTALAVVGAETPGIELGVSVVPIFGRHPMPLAIQALTTQAACGGRLVLGIGVSHAALVERPLGLSYRKAYSYAREFLAALAPLLRGEPVEVQGEQVVARGALAIDGAPPPQILLGALAPKMLELAGRETAGVATWMVGPKTLAGHVAPSVRRAAEAAGRAEPRVVVGIPTCVTDDVERVRTFAREKLALYGTLPVYQKMLATEGLSGPEDLVLAGDEAAVGAKLDEIAAAGATDLRFAEICPTPEAAERTRAFARARLSL